MQEWFSNNWDWIAMKRLEYQCYLLCSYSYSSTHLCPLHLFLLILQFWNIKCAFFGLHIHVIAQKMQERELYKLAQLQSKFSVFFLLIWRKRFPQICKIKANLQAWCGWNIFQHNTKLWMNTFCFVGLSRVVTNNILKLALLKKRV